MCNMEKLIMRLDYFLFFYSSFGSFFVHDTLFLVGDLLRGQVYNNIFFSKNENFPEN